MIIIKAGWLKVSIISPSKGTWSYLNMAKLESHSLKKGKFD